MDFQSAMHNACEGFRVRRFEWDVTEHVFVGLDASDPDEIKPRFWFGWYDGSLNTRPYNPTPADKADRDWEIFDLDYYINGEGEQN